MDFKVCNASHPELKPGEVFLRNDANNGFSRVKAVLPSARQGQTGYDTRGNKLDTGLKPIFVRPDELRAAGGPLMLEVRYAEIGECQQA